MRIGKIYKHLVVIATGRYTIINLQYSQDLFGFVSKFGHFAEVFSGKAQREADI